MKMTKAQKKRLVVTVLLCTAVLLIQKETMFAGQVDQSQVDEFMQPFNNFTYLLTTLVSAFGEAFTLWGIGEWGLAWQDSQGGNMSAQAFKRLFGGFVMIAAPQILSLLT